MRVSSFRKGSKSLGKNLDKNMRRPRSLFLNSVISFKVNTETQPHKALVYQLARERFIFNIFPEMQKARSMRSALLLHFSTSCANFWAAYAKNMLKYALLILWKKGRSCKFLRFLHLCQRILDGVKISTASCSYLILCRNQPYSVSTMQNLQRTRQCLDLTKLVFKV